MSQNIIFTETLRNRPSNRPPVWFMRQAGRVLPSYQALKENHSFWDLMLNPDLAAKVTLLPVYDLGVDAAILFSDILVIPYALGMGLDFSEKGPVFENPLKNEANPLMRLNPDPSKLNYIYDAIRKIIEIRPNNTPLIGFCGAPLTVLCYMLQGLGRNESFPDAIKFIYTNKETTKKLIDAITELSIVYIKNQIKNGIDVFQLFETHAGLIPNDLYNELFLPAVRKIGNAVRESNIPFIFFPKGLGAGITEIDYSICDYLSIDWQISMKLARKLVDPKVGLQGNLDPRILYADKQTIENELSKYIQFGRENSNWIFNLGHGFLADTPFENAKFITDWVKNADWER